MPTDLIDLINYQPSNRFYVATPDNTDENFIIKGFVSVQIADRDKELVNPAAFDIPSYMAQPAVLVNHALWTNKSGKKVGVGIPLSLHEVKLKSSDKPGMWSVWDVNAKKEVDVFPKERNPNLGVGSRGLYTFIRLTDPDVIKMAKTGELSGFSWRGLSRPSYVYDDKTKSTYKSYSHIDLIEITLATAPNNIGSSFIVSKDAIHSYQFDKSKYTRDNVTSQLAMERVENFGIVEDDNKIYAYDMTRQLDEDGLLVVKMADGASLVLGSPPVSSAVLTLPEDEKENFLKAVACSKETKMADPVTTPAVPETPPVVSTPEVQPVAKTTETPPAAPSINMEEVVTKAVDAVMGKITPMFEKMSESVQALAQIQSAMVEKMTPTTPAAPATPVVVETKPDPLALVDKRVSELTKQLETVQKSVSTITPMVPSRTEGSTPTAPPKKDPNGVFNPLFGIK